MDSLNLVFRNFTVCLWKVIQEEDFRWKTVDLLVVFVVYYLTSLQ